MRILHAIHDFLPRHQAGSEIYAYELGHEQQNRGHQAHVLCAEYDPSRSHGSLVWRWYEGLPVTELINNWAFASFAESYQSPRINAQLDHVLRAVEPDVVHIHNLLNLSLDLPSIAAARRVPCVATLHDFSLVCPSGGQRVHRAEKHVCSEIDTRRCARCFPQSPFHAQMVFARLSRRRGLALSARIAGWVRRLFPRFFGWLGRAAGRYAPQPALMAEELDQRLDKVREVFAAVDHFVAPSPALADDFRRFGLPSEKIRVADYGFPPLASSPRRSPPGDGRLRVGFVGTLTWHKGVHVLIEAIRLLPLEHVEVKIFGSLDTFPQYVAELRRSARGLPITFAGAFDRQHLAAVYAQMDVLVVASLWPENSPLVIHEAYMAGVPVVGARIGGIVDLVDEERNGLLYDPFSADELADRLRSLLLEPDRLRRYRHSLPEVKTITEDAQEWEAVYRQLVGQPSLV